MKKFISFILISVLIFIIFKSNINGNINSYDILNQKIPNTKIESEKNNELYLEELKEKIYFGIEVYNSEYIGGEESSVLKQSLDFIEEFNNKSEDTKIIIIPKEYGFIIMERYNGYSEGGEYIQNILFPKTKIVEKVFYRDNVLYNMLFS